jgi:putative endopeptidase
MDRGADPSEDFYRYAVGRWIDTHPIPPDKSRWGSFAELTERNFQLIHRLLDDCNRPGAAGVRPVERLVGDFYASAMDTDRLASLGFGPLRAELARLEEVRSTEELLRLVAAFHRMGVGGLFITYVAPDKRASGVYAFYLHQGGLSLPDRDYYLQPSFAAQAEGYRAHVAKMLVLLGDSPSDAAESARTIFDLEKRLAEAGRSRADLREEEKNYTKMEVAELLRRYPNTPWATYLKGRELAGLKEIVVSQPEFHEAVDRLLGEVPLSTWTTYLRWHLVHAAAPFLHDEAEREDFEFFHKALVGQPQPEPRWLRAARVLDAAIGEAVGELYVERHFPPEARARMTELVHDLREVFHDRLARLPWMTPGTRAKALAKFDRFTAKIGHPDTFRDYSSIRVDPRDYLGNIRRSEEFENHRQVVRVGGPVDRTEWAMTPPMVNAYFDPAKNEIVFPAGILQPPFFDLAMDDAVNYGAIGGVIGHEITHGYDDQGRKYDADGNLADWWTEADAREFGVRAAQVVEQYDRYEPLPGAHVNGRLTLGENIADMGGLSIAFEALERRLAAQPARRKVVDGFTPEQRFFLAWAQVWRENIREAAVTLRLTVDPHSPGRYRAIGPLSNFPAFAEAFAIREGSAMRRPPAERVAIW